MPILQIFTMPNCQPCSIVKEAVAHPDILALVDIKIDVVGIEEIRGLRKDIGQRLSLPILAVLDENGLASRRFGVSHTEVENERNEIVAWLASVIERRSDRSSRK